MKKIIASIIVPTYNRKEKLVQTVEHIERQDYPYKNFEIIIIDDCSSDGTHLAVQHLLKKYNNLEYLRNDKNVGPATSRNRGINVAKGNYIFFTDDDCIVPLNWLFEYVNFFNKNPKVGLIGGPLIPVSKNFIAKIEIFKNKVLGIYLKNPTIGGSEVPVGFTSNSAYRKEVFKKIGYFNEKFTVAAGEDLDFRDRACKKFRAAFLPISVVHNHNYDLNYIIDILFKQGLNKKPPQKMFIKLAVLLYSLPLLFYTILKKTLKYRLKLIV